MNEYFSCQIVSRAPQNIITLETIKKYLRIIHNHDDELLTILIDSAIETAEHYIRYAITDKVVRLSLRKFRGQVIDLPIGKLTAIRAVTIGKENISLEGVRSFDHQIFLPMSYSGEAIIEYMVGTAADAVPTALKQGIMRHVAEMYDREGELLGVPQECIRLYTPHRLIIV